MAKFLMLLSSGREEADYQSMVEPLTTSTINQNRFYECKTCNRQFPSFQALGGHRASHKKPRLEESVLSGTRSINDNQQQKKKPKAHECSICGLEFSVGQALGGHMRKHRAVTAPVATPTETMGLSSSSSDTTTYKQQPLELVEISNSRRLLSLNLDLNLTSLPTTAMGSNEFEFSALIEPHKQISVLDTLVGEHRTQMSGRQKQRVAISRAILKDP
ncbi:zinc finger protein ZAT12-like [Papaver somniferum]|uniref:zinc finger protein ZAT12-like n=1 Tax=Papaver somniferum TaxID=3469 RepID=UPI000E6F5AA5|nr:zinc finger protein ZAT12-like [Papaver somniferum]